MRSTALFSACFGSDMLKSFSKMPMKPLKPYMLRRWRLERPPRPVYFFTCARPGRKGNPRSKNLPVSDELVHRWVLGLPGPRTAILSLLGRKPDGTSEFSFYSFYGGLDLESDRPSCLSFQNWLDRWHSDLSIVLREHPTWDFKPISMETLDTVSKDLTKLALAGHTVVIVDSGGVTRTGSICRYIAAIEDSSSWMS
jgi:hypothetical protein